MSKRTILFVITKGNWGGAQKYVFEMANGLPSDAFAAEVVCGQGEILPEKLAAAGIPVTTIKQLGRDLNPLADFVSFVKLLRIMRARRPDVVHLNSSKAGGLGALAARLARVRKIVFTVHGFAWNEDRPAWQKTFIRFASWLSLVLATDAICITRSDFEAARRWPLVSKKLHFILNGIASPLFLEQPLAREEITRLAGKPELYLNGKVVIGTIAELTQNKGLDTALEAMKDTDNCAYVIIGGGEDRQYLENIVAENALHDRVLMTGFVPDASKLLLAFDIFLLPSLKEGLPYVLIEAGFAGLPVVATTVGGVGEIIEDERSGLLVEPKSARQIQQTLMRLIGNKNLRNELGSALEARTREHFNSERMVFETAKVYM